MKPVLIVNPRSGGGRTGKTFDAMLPVIERALGPVEVVRTERPRHATALAREAADTGAPLVVAVGGDGTLSEVANGLLRAAKGGARLGLIAQGTGGDFRRTIGLEHRLDRYLEALASGRERPLDVGRIRYRTPEGGEAEHYFVNVLSAGMGGLVDRYVADAPAWLGGKAAYFLASARALATSELGHLRCTVGRNGATEERRLATYMIAVCNGQYFGGGMHVAPMARPDDGKFEVVALGGRHPSPSKLAFALDGRKIYDGSHLRAAGTEHFACDRMTIALENPEVSAAFLLDVDGEPLGGLPLEVELLPGALTLRA